MRRPGAGARRREDARLVEVERPEVHVQRREPQPSAGPGAAVERVVGAEHRATLGPLKNAVVVELRELHGGGHAVVGGHRRRNARLALVDRRVQLLLAGEEARHVEEAVRQRLHETRPAVRQQWFHEVRVESRPDAEHMGLLELPLGARTCRIRCARHRYPFSLQTQTAK